MKSTGTEKENPGKVTLSKALGEREGTNGRDRTGKEQKRIRWKARKEKRQAPVGLLNGKGYRKRKPKSSVAKSNRTE